MHFVRIESILLTAQKLFDLLGSTHDYPSQLEDHQSKKEKSKGSLFDGFFGVIQPYEPSVCIIKRREQGTVHSFFKWSTKAYLNQYQNQGSTQKEAKEVSHANGSVEI